MNQNYSKSYILLWRKSCPKCLWSKRPRHFTLFILAILFFFVHFYCFFILSKIFFLFTSKSNYFRFFPRNDMIWGNLSIFAWSIYVGNSLISNIAGLNISNITLSKSTHYIKYNFVNKFIGIDFRLHLLLRTIIILRKNKIMESQRTYCEIVVLWNFASFIT